ncbi:MAG: protein-L-isoaspartate(D-aspartate) O-methyltransferase [Gammaproteobacteria bacterium]|nr:protein-L-isoaspartate(D-aspartate) O-methyltransferase [Gammaproteobacteria bacterium]
MDKQLESGIGMTSLRTRKRLVLRLQERGIQDPHVLRVLFNTPRHLFVDEALAHRAYEEVALPIGLGQTLSQPYTVARMTELLLEGGKIEKVLEIGTGSGYQTVILAQLIQEVYTLECLPALLSKAKNRFHQLGFRNIHASGGNGILGLEKHQPYSGILVTAAALTAPLHLLNQLSIGGRMVIPLEVARAQKLHLIIRRGVTDFEYFAYDAVHFVPLVG